jgi:ubiquinol-cytochrome c reductase cytochrome b subunit
MRILNGLYDWIEDRSGYRRLIAFYRDVPLPDGLRWSNTVGAALLATLLFECLSGALLALSYSPSVDSAYPSVRFLSQETELGLFLRSVHSYGAHVIVILMVLCGLKTFITRSYTRPREIQWLLGLALAGLIIAIATTGYLLPWDQYGYWGTQVRTSIMGSVPVVGTTVKTIALGGTETGNLTLTRFYTGHAILLPVLLLAGLFLYVTLRTRNSYLIVAESQVEGTAYWPGQASRDVLVSLVVVSALMILSGLLPVRLGNIADPLETYPARPEWYFRWLFQTLKYLEPPFEVIGTVVIPHAILVVLALVPFLDRGHPRRLGRRVVVSSLALVGLAWTGLSSVSFLEDYRSGHFREIKMWEAQADPSFDVNEFYKAKCNRCHGRNGAGMLDSTPDFTSEVYWAGVRSDVRLVKTILHGVPNTSIPEDERMPSFSDLIGPSEAKALVERKIRAFAPSGKEE